MEVWETRGRLNWAQVETWSQRLLVSIDRNCGRLWPELVDDVCIYVRLSSAKSRQIMLVPGRQKAAHRRYESMRYTRPASAEEEERQGVVQTTLDDLTSEVPSTERATADVSHTVAYRQAERPTDHRYGRAGHPEGSEGYLVHAIDIHFRDESVLGIRIDATSRKIHRDLGDNVGLRAPTESTRGPPSLQQDSKRCLPGFTDMSHPPGEHQSRTCVASQQLLGESEMTPNWKLVA